MYTYNGVKGYQQNQADWQSVVVVFKNILF